LTESRTNYTLKTRNWVASVFATDCVKVLAT